MLFRSDDMFMGVIGPFTSDQLKQKAASGELRSATPVAKEIGGPWLPASSVKGLVFKSATPPPLKLTPPPLKTEGLEEGRHPRSRVAGRSAQQVSAMKRPRSEFGVLSNLAGRLSRSGAVGLGLAILIAAAGLHQLGTNTPFLLAALAAVTAYSLVVWLLFLTMCAFESIEIFLLVVGALSLLSIPGYLLFAGTASVAVVVAVIVQIVVVGSVVKLNLNGVLSPAGCTGHYVLCQIGIFVLTLALGAGEMGSRLILYKVLGAQ